MAGSGALASSTLTSFATVAATSAMAAATSTTATEADPLVGTSGYCIPGNSYDGYLGARVSSIFVILVGSMFGESSFSSPSQEIRPLTHYL